MFYEPREHTRKYVMVYIYTLALLLHANHISPIICTLLFNQDNN